MRIAAMAAGAVGGYFGGRLAAAGHDVSFVARGAQLAAIRKNGLKIESPLGDLHLNNVRATSDPKDIGPVDVVLFAVKLWDTETAAEAAKPLVGAQTRVITLQNGVDSVERIAPILGEDKVAGGSAYIASVIGAPGVISHTSQFAKMVCGRIDGKPDAQLAAFTAAAKEAGIDITQSENINRERWEKFVFLVGLSGATGSTRMPLGPILADPDTRAFFRSLMEEVIALARAKGVTLAPDFLESRMKFADGAPPGMKASLLHDLERGNRIEIDWLAGKVVALGRELGVPTPANAAVYAALKLHRMGRNN
ncbi:MAG TPA: 2-dehydropantoate 2-reductase [Xanthobacteraceae bacterium]|nr:2-dehydropantoate 2-reductase [Xanthobacteraceae bacterium]